MKLFKQMEQLSRMHKLIKESRTGTPDKFAQTIGISVRRLHAIMDEMSGRGAPIGYSRRWRSYYYKRPFELIIECSFEVLSEEEITEITAGYKIVNNFSFTAFFVQ